MRTTLKIKRFNPERDDRPWWGEYTVEAEPTDRVLDALHLVKWYQDGTFALRRSCAHGICGSDAMLINGVNRLACKLLIRDLAQPIVVEPMRGFPVIKDLVVDMEGFFGKYRSVLPYLINEEPLPERERLQSPAERARFDDTTKCILCGACTTACPSFWANSGYVGPAAIVAAHRFIFDSRDRGEALRLSLLAERDGVWRCRTILNCTAACPRGIDVGRAIAEVKYGILRHSGELISAAAPVEEKKPMTVRIREALSFDRLLGGFFLLTAVVLLGLTGIFTYQAGSGILLEGRSLNDYVPQLIFIPGMAPTGLLSLVLAVVFLWGRRR